MCLRKTEEDSMKGDKHKEKMTDEEEGIVNVIM